MGRLSTINASDYRLSDDYPTIDYWRVSAFLPVVWLWRADVRDLAVFCGSIFVAQCWPPGVSLSDRRDVWRENCRKWHFRTFTGSVTAFSAYTHINTIPFLSVHCAPSQVEIDGMCKLWLVLEPFVMR